MIDLMYDLPEHPKGTRYQITGDIVEGKAKMTQARKRAKKESA